MVLITIWAPSQIRIYKLNLQFLQGPQWPQVLSCIKKIRQQCFTVCNKMYPWSLPHWRIPAFTKTTQFWRKIGQAFRQPIGMQNSSLDVMKYHFPRIKGTQTRYTDKKENQIFLIYKEIQSGAHSNPAPEKIEIQIP